MIITMDMYLGGLFLVTIVGALFQYTLNQKFPPIKVLKMDGTTSEIITRRMVGGKIVKNDLLQIMMNGSDMAGWRLDDFEHTTHDFKMLGLLPSPKKMLWCVEIAGEMVPIYLPKPKPKMNANGTYVKDKDGNLIMENIIDVQTVKSAKDMAFSIHSARRMAIDDLKRSQPLAGAFLQALPQLLLLLGYGVMFYLLMQSIAEVEKNNLQLAQDLMNTTDLLMGKVNVLYDNVVGMPQNYQPSGGNGG